MKRLFHIVILLLMSDLASAQFNTFPCVDSTRISPFFQCNDPRFQPVCGCNFVTYRNDCVSFNIYGVNRVEYEGVCQNDVFFFDFFPNVVTYQFRFFLQFWDRGAATIEIRDAFGKLQFYQLVPSREYFETVIDGSYLRPGIYFISVRSGNVYKVKKFVRIAA